MRVPVLDLRAQYAALRHEIEPVVLATCASQGFVMGPEVEAFEREIAAAVRTPHAIACASGSDALILALRALGVGAGDEVVTTPFTFFASGGAVSLVGARPVFADIDAGTFNLDPECLERAIGPRTRAIIAVDLFGQCADLSAILEVASRRRIPVIEDAAQSLGAEHRGRRTGEWTLATFSFYPAKNLGGFGDGGMIATPDAAQARVLRQLRVHGESSRYVHERVGMNSRLDALQAAILRVKLRHLDDWIAARQRIAAEYTRRLSALGLEPRLVLPVTASHATRHVFNQYTVRARERDALREHLTAAGIGSMIYYPIPLHLQPCFRDLGGTAGDFPVAESAADEVLSLPIYPELQSDQIDLVVEAIGAFYAAR
ncbi:MAG TPA: DegT/DnrJ/EryC1/StrS family aminotransferase [Pseudomonadales bacterium]